MDWKGLQIYILCKVLKLYNSKRFCCDICNYVDVQFGNKLSIGENIHNIQNIIYIDNKYDIKIILLKFNLNMVWHNYHQTLWFDIITIKHYGLI